MSRADKTQTAIVYDLLLDERNERVRELHVTVLCASRTDQGPVTGADALTTRPHVAFFTRYRFSREDQVERFEVPAEAAKLCR
ncbi:MAG: hypothetical protein KF878_29270 [Planctomycetes bacterium]|nr:hypothetical protein [Planctomycetota bacterium]